MAEAVRHGARPARHRRGAEAHTLLWRSNAGRDRTGFAAVAVAAGPGCRVYPCFVENCEVHVHRSAMVPCTPNTNTQSRVRARVFARAEQEMRWNPVFDLWTLLRLDLAYGRLMRALPWPLGWIMWEVQRE